MVNMSGKHHKRTANWSSVFMPFPFCGLSQRRNT